MKTDTLKKFVKTHKTKIIIGSTVAATAAVSVYLRKNIKSDDIVTLVDSSGEFMFTATKAGLQKIVDSGGEFQPDFMEGIIVSLTEVK